ncbi:MAG: hypothetical protein QOE67_328 [Solirubrobacteraceae bacterium]|jgi:hypothetical protein|nr:hypothetical protein [Solirubrobacteraceae bacterium]
MCRRVRFRITRHSGFAPPVDAMELLLRRLGAERDEVSFAMSGVEIAATSPDGEGDSTIREARIEVARRAIFDIIDEVCGSAPELESDWFAVSYVA